MTSGQVHVELAEARNRSSSPRVCSDPDRNPTRSAISATAGWTVGISRTASSAAEGSSNPRSAASTRSCGSTEAERTGSRARTHSRAVAAARSSPSASRSRDAAMSPATAHGCDTDGGRPDGDRPDRDRRGEERREALARATASAAAATVAESAMTVRATAWCRSRAQRTAAVDVGSMPSSPRADVRSTQPANRWLASVLAPEVTSAITTSASSTPGRDAEPSSVRSKE